MKSKHYIFINQYYPPDLAPTGTMLRDLVEEIAAQGNRVTILCSGGGYAGAGESRKESTEGEKPGIKVRRLAATRWGRTSNLGKLCDYACFYFFAFWKGLTLPGSPDCYIALTTPPYVSILVRVVSKLRGAVHAHWVMDLYPDVMVAHGILGAGGWADKLLSAIARWGLGGKRNRATISLGPDMAERLRSKYGVQNSAWVPLWSSASWSDSVAEQGAELRKARGWDGKTVFLYSGNMGLGHCVSDFLSLAADHADNAQLVFAFFGGGKRLSEIEDFVAAHPQSNVETQGYVPQDQLAAHLLSADIHLASLQPAWDGCMVPSKIQGITRSGRPVLFIGSSTCSIGAWILGARAGWVVSPGDRDGLRCAVREASSQSERKARGESALLLSRRHFQRVKNVKATARLLM